MRILKKVLGVMLIFIGAVGLLTGIGIIISETLTATKVVGVFFAIFMLLAFILGIKLVREPKQPQAVQIHNNLHSRHLVQNHSGEFPEMEDQVEILVDEVFDDSVDWNGNKPGTQSWSNTTVMQWSSASGEPMPEEMKRVLSGINLFQMPVTPRREMKAEKEPEAVKKPVSMDCPGCGAKLPAKSAEIVICEYCGTEVAYKNR